MKKKVKFEFVEVQYFTRHGCHVCGGCTDKVNILCEVKTGQDKGMRICEQCLQAGKEQVDARLQAHAKELEKGAVHMRSMARYMRTLVGCLEIPTYEALEKAQKKHSEEYMKKYHPEYATEATEKKPTEAVRF
jgi:hypothetical protein